MAKSVQTGQRRSWPLVLVTIVAAVILVAVFAGMRRPDAPIRIDHATRGPLVASISTNGKIEPEQNFEAHAPAPGTVQKVLVKQGDHVTAGQLLVQMDDADARAQAAHAAALVKSAEADLHAIQRGGTQEEVLNSQSELNKAKADLADAQRNLGALQKLQSTGAASPAEVQVAQERVNRAQADVRVLEQKRSDRYSPAEVARVQAQLSQARASYDAAEDLLKHSNIRAPQAGLVYSLPVKAGAYVGAGDLLVQVADLHKLVVRAFVDEPDIGRLHAGQTVQVTWDAAPGRVWLGSVISVPTTVTLRGTRTVGEVTATMDNKDLALLPNINVTVVLVTARDDNALSVAREAVHQEDGQRFVYEVVGGELKRRNVQTSISNLTRIEITNGLQDNALVAINSLNGQPLRPNMQVRVVQP